MMTKLFVAYTQVDGLAFARHFDRGVPVYVGRRRDYGAVVNGERNSSLVAVIARDERERRRMRASLPHLGFVNTVDIYDTAPANLAAQVRAKKPDIVLISMDGRRDACMEEFYRLTCDMFETPGTSRALMQRF